MIYSTVVTSFLSRDDQYSLPVIRARRTPPPWGATFGTSKLPHTLTLHSTIWMPRGLKMRITSPRDTGVNMASRSRDVPNRDHRIAECLPYSIKVACRAVHDVGSHTTKAHDLQYYARRGLVEDSVRLLRNEGSREAREQQKLRHETGSSSPWGL